MHNSEATNSSHLERYLASGSARVSPPTQAATSSPSSEHRHQHNLSAELSGAGTWTACGAEAQCDDKDVDAAVVRSNELADEELSSHNRSIQSSHKFGHSEPSSKHNLVCPANTDPRRDSFLATSTSSVRSHESYEFVDSDISFGSQKYDSEGNREENASALWTVTCENGSTIGGAEQYSPLRKGASLTVCSTGS